MYCSVKCHSAEFHFSKCHSADCCSKECHSAMCCFYCYEECHSPECHSEFCYVSVILLIVVLMNGILRSAVFIVMKMPLSLVSFC